MTKEQIIDTVSKKRINFIIFLTIFTLIISAELLLGIFFYYNAVVLFLAVVSFILSVFILVTNYARFKAPLIISQAEGIIQKIHIEKILLTLQDITTCRR